MSKHFIFSDTHHGSDKVVDYLGKKAGKGKISASSTGDFCVYAAKSGAPPELKHAFTDAYKKGDKAGMKKHEASWSKEVVGPKTVESGEKLQELKGKLKGGKVNSIYGNSEF